MMVRRPTTIAFRMLLASALLACVITAALTALVVAVGSLRGAIRHEAHAKDTLAGALRLEAATRDVESSLRGYLLTSNERFLRPWRRSLASLGPAQRRLDALARDDPQLRPRVRALDRELHEYVADYAEPLIAIARFSPPIARSALAAEEGRRRADALRRRFDGLVKAEDARATERAAEVRRASSIATGAAVGALAVSGALIVVVGGVGARTLSRRLRHAEVAAGEIAGGDFSVRLAEEGPAELVGLGRAFNRMAGSLDESRRTLLEQNRRLETNERRKTELITIVAHELRTPLAALIGFTSLLVEREQDAATRRRYLTIVYEESQRLSTLVDRFLDVGQVEDEAFVLALEPLDLAQLLRQHAERAVARSTLHILVFSFPDRALMVNADRERLSQVIESLVGNAVKYSPEGGSVHIVVRDRGEHIVVEITDRGLGIPAEEQPHVFTKFFRGHAASRGIPGTGLGLAVAREIVVAHGGRIGFESRPGWGSTFWIELVRAPADAAAGHRSETTP
jgi:signal transduction histidine kinase